jgi:hypothetical protein
MRNMHGWVTYSDVPPLYFISGFILLLVELLLLANSFILNFVI